MMMMMMVVVVVVVERWVEKDIGTSLCSIAPAPQIGSR
jgi:hypothetical protein